MVKPPYDLNTAATANAAATAAPLSPTSTLKFLCSYGGEILPRYSDGTLRYFGGHTRVLAVNRSISFPKLLSKLEDLCGSPVSLRCQLPSEDLDALISIKSDEDLANLVEEYDGAGSSSLKIKAFLSPPPRSTSQKHRNTSPRSSDASSPTSSTLSSSNSSPSAAAGSTLPPRCPVPVANRFVHLAPAPVMAFPFTSAGKVANYACGVHYGKSNPMYFVHNGNRRQ